MIVGEELFLRLKKLVGVLLVGQPQFVGVFGQRLDQAAKLLLGVLGAHTQVLIVLKKHAKVRIESEARMRGQSGQEHLMHLNCLLEHGQIFAKQ